MGGKPCFFNIELLSKPSKRIYWTVNFLSKNYRRDNFSSFYIINTSQGLFVHNDILLYKKVFRWE